ncbi:hypothetical protein D3C79_526150 [compost metagenome]
MLTQYCAQRKGHRLLATLTQRQKHRRFTQPTPQPHANHAKHPSQQEWQTPGVIKNFLRRKQLRQCRGRQGTEQITEGQSRLEKAQGVPSPSNRCMFRDKNPCAGHFTADRGALKNTQRQ